jgi:hypothetical protein
MAAVVVKDVSEARVQMLKAIYEIDYGVVTVTLQPDGLYTVEASNPKVPEQPDNTVDVKGASREAKEPTRLTDFAAEVVRLCEQEWSYFGKQEYRSDGVCTRVGKKEADGQWSDRISEYWSFGVKLTGVTGKNTDQYWSAAFISWIMRTARNDETTFRYSSQHSVYIAHSIRQRLSGTEAGFWGHRLSEHKPKPGDLLCYSRTTDVDYDHQMGGDYPGHCDIVVEVQPDCVWVIGGNVGNSVSKRPVALNSTGYFEEGMVYGEYLFAVMECRVDRQAAADKQSMGSVVQDGATPSMAWGKKVSKEFRKRVFEISQWLSCDVSHLMAAIAFESGETFSPSVKNPQSSATGLIQFTKNTALDLGTTVEALAAMTDIEQLDYVEKYLSPYKGKMQTLSDVYMCILWPKAVGKPEAEVLFARGTRAYDVNDGLDVNHDGAITKGEASSVVQAKLNKGLRADYVY